MDGGNSREEKKEKRDQDQNGGVGMAADAH
jgi:hypothetical protein